MTSELGPRRVTERDLRFLQEKAAAGQADPDAMLAVIAEALRLRDAIRELENCITWGISCNACADKLDESYNAYARAEQAEAKLIALGVFPSSPLTVFRVDPGDAPPPVTVSWDAMGHPTVTPVG